MRKGLVTSMILAGWMGLASCRTGGIIELSRADTQRCYQFLAQDGELLTAAVTALDDCAANVPGSQSKLLDTRTQCRDHLEEWNRLVSELYEKYGVSEERYRLDVFRGRFFPTVMKERTETRE